MSRRALNAVPLKRFLDQRLIDAIAHPARAHVLATLNERIASPSEVADEIGVDVKYLNYHFEELERNECIELVKTEPKRGATKHFYRAKKTMFFGNQEWQALPRTLRLSFSAQWFQAIVDDAARAVKGGTFDSRSDRHLSWTPLLVDERGWHDVNAALNEALSRVLAIGAESAERLDGGDQPSIPITIGITGFETPLKSADFDP